MAPPFAGPKSANIKTLPPFVLRLRTVSPRRAEIAEDLVVPRSAFSALCGEAARVDELYGSLAKARTR